MAMRPSTTTSPSATPRKSLKMSASPAPGKGRLPPYTDPEIAEDAAIERAGKRFRRLKAKGLTPEEMFEAALKGE